MPAEVSTLTSAGWPRLCIVGPLPPPAGGMANQCAQLVRLLRADGAEVELVRNNAPYRPAAFGRFPVLRAGARMLPYLFSLWRAAGRADVIHVLANSGWAWHLFAAPALLVGLLRGTPVIVNYRGGQAEEFLAAAPSHVLSLMRRAALCVTPSDFLRRVFAHHGLDVEVIPNIIDLDRFGAQPTRDFGDAPHLVVARNLEPIYGIDTALRAMVIVRRRFPGASLTVAGSGPQRGELEAQVSALGLVGAIHFPGSIDHASMPALYARADCALNPSTVDNMPNSILEAFACGVPVVSTDVGGVPDIVSDGVNGLLVPASDAAAMGHALLRLLDDRDLAHRLAQAAAVQVQSYAWPQVRKQWLSAYRRAAAPAGH